MVEKIKEENSLVLPFLVMLCIVAAVNAGIDFSKGDILWGCIATGIFLIELTLLFIAGKKGL